MVGLTSTPIGGLPFGSATFLYVRLESVYIHTKQMTNLQADFCVYYFELFHMQTPVKLINCLT